MPIPSVTGFSTLRLRSYVFRLPLFTRAILAGIVVFWVAGLQSAWDLRAWGALVPDEIGIQTRRFSFGSFLKGGVGGHRLYLLCICLLTVADCVLSLAPLNPLPLLFYYRDSFLAFCFVLPYLFSALRDDTDC